MVPSRYRLHDLPQRRQRRHPLGRHPEIQRPNCCGYLSRLPLEILFLLLLLRQRQPVFLLRHVQILAHDECRGTNVEFRKCMGMVLLDVDDGVSDAVGLEGGHGEWDFAV